ncbi:MAG: hypothetical protein ABRQ39_27635 [Candidatus Eremiobacterota bacterium]
MSAIANMPDISSCLNPAISLQPDSGKRLAVTRFPDLPSKTDANFFAVAQRIAAQDVLRTEGKPTRDFSLILSRYRLLASFRYNQEKQVFPAHPADLSHAKIGAAAEKIA